jgi:ABC-2 type transport system ATP-binding protein
MKAALITNSIVKRYGSKIALNGMTASIPSASITGLIGANGAGKTTWMMAVAGFLRIQSGSVNLLGGGPFNPALHRGRVSILPQDSELPCESYPLETLVHYGRLQGLSKVDADQSARSVLTAVHLADRMNNPIRTLSHGMRKRVMIAQCFIGKPELILLDEPLSGLDPREVANMRNFISAKSPGQTIVISSHNLYDLELLCDYIVFVKKGKTTRTATIAELTDKTAILVYNLTSAPLSTADLSELLPECTLTLSDHQSQLSCSFDKTRVSAEQINATLIPALLKSTGIISIERGRSLEEQVLNEL